MPRKEDPRTSREIFQAEHIGGVDGVKEGIFAYSVLLSFVAAETPVRA